jgi:succinate-semialdehyde dehydrogenase/glutarate-semialdehyde dehydrogenase
MLERGLLIGAHEVRSGTVHEVLNPASGVVIGNFVVADAEAVDRAVDMAAAAQTAWGSTSSDVRAQVLRTAAALIERDADAIARTLTLEQGKPVPDSRKEVLFGAEVLRYYADRSALLDEEVRRTTNADFRSVVRHVPLGVVGGIVPWNYPVDLWCWKVAPALMAGNAVVMKPPLETPLAAGMVARLLYEAGLPDGVLSDLPGGLEAGAAISTHRGIRGISATCSTAAGVAIMQAAAPTMKRLTLELGGNCPLVVLDDADIRAAAAAAARRSFSNAGQICIAVNRIVVMKSVADEFVGELAAIVDALHVGDPIEPDVVMGPTTTAAVLEKTQQHVADAIRRGARVVAGASTQTLAVDPIGHFMRPVVLDEVPVTASIAREETFGPAVAVLRVDSEQDALRLANDSMYGLAAYVYTGDSERGQTFARGLEYGGIGINVNDVTELDAPFGGWKMSGFGRDLGPEALLGMTEPQHIRTRLP